MNDFTVVQGQPVLVIPWKAVLLERIALLEKELAESERLRQDMRKACESAANRKAIGELAGTSLIIKKLKDENAALHKAHSDAITELLDATDRLTGREREIEGYKTCVRNLENLFNDRGKKLEAMWEQTPFEDYEDWFDDDGNLKDG
jgi:hypothetical protein